MGTDFYIATALLNGAMEFHHVYGESWGLGVLRSGSFPH